MIVGIQGLGLIGGSFAKAYSEIEGFKASKFDNAVLDKIASSNFKEE